MTKPTSPRHPLVSTAELARHLGEPDWAVVDCRFHLAEPDRGEREYETAHVPGAVYAHLDRDLSGPLTGTNGRHPMPSVEQIIRRFSDWGIDERVRVAAYDQLGGQVAARLWWMLRYVGHDLVFVLDGGWPLWVEEGRPERGGREERDRRTFVPRIRPDMRIDVSSLEPPGALESLVLIDARAPERYRGEQEPLDPVAGHIPGARNHPSASNLDDEGRFLPPDELHRRFESALAGRPLEEAVSYCGSGVTACHNLLAMEVAGLEGARLYPGSWSEWCSGGFRPVARGEEPSS